MWASPAEVDFAGVAAATVPHNRKITTDSHEHLGRSFVLLMEKPWTVPRAGKHFEKARKPCNNRIR